MIVSSLFGTYLLAFVFGILVIITIFKIFISEDDLAFLVKEAFIYMLYKEIEELEKEDDDNDD